MGTDIHLIVEVDENCGEDDPRWFVLGAPAEECYMCKATGVIDRDKLPHYKKEWLDERHGKPCSNCSVPMSLSSNYAFETYGYCGVPGYLQGSWYDDRNYTVFAALANVRNGRGFAGIFTHIPIEPISDPRGLPGDLSRGGRAWFETNGGDHSDSWLDLDEVLNYNWDQPLYRSGVMDLNDWNTYRKGEKFGWSGSIDGSMVRNVTNEEMDRRLAEATRNEWGNLVSPDGLVYVTQLAWKDTLADACSEFLKRMRKIKELVGHAPTRIVFNFDS
jgi:hypothetical protein